MRSGPGRRRPRRRRTRGRWTPGRRATRRRGTRTWLLRRPEDPGRRTEADSGRSRPRGPARRRRPRRRRRPAAHGRTSRPSRRRPRRRRDRRRATRPRLPTWKRRARTPMPRARSRRRTRRGMRRRSAGEARLHGVDSAVPAAASQNEDVRAQRAVARGVADGEDEPGRGAGQVEAAGEAPRRTPEARRSTLA